LRVAMRKVMKRSSWNRMNGAGKIASGVLREGAAPTP